MATISNVNGQLELTIANKIEYYQFPKLSNLTWVFNNDGNYYIHMIYEDDYFVKIRLIDITNQPGWTNDQPGAAQAVKDISTWIGLVTLPPSGLATEATLLNVLTAVDNMRDYEVRLVVDSTPVTPVTWLEVRYWDAQSGSLGTPVYYLAGSTTPGSPVLPISYINNQTLLSQILAELQGTLDVNITNAAVTVNGTVAVTQSTSPWVVGDGGGSITVDGTIAATQSGTWNIAAVTGPVALPTGAATESTLSTLNSQFTAVTRTPALIRTSASGTISAGARSISVFNAGAAAGSILGIVGNILPGEVFEFSAGGENDTLAAFAYNGTGTTLVITSIV